MDIWVAVAPVLGVVGLLVAFGIYRAIVAAPVGTDRMRDIAFSRATLRCPGFFATNPASPKSNIAPCSGLPRPGLRVPLGPATQKEA
jgi:hypothetical protein